MARPLDEEKRNSILSAATEAVATHGIAASTARIAKHAGIAEGTLFVYFSTKDDLLNALYLTLKADMKAWIEKGYPGSAGVRDCCEHLWNQSINWGAENPQKRKAMRQLAVSDKVTEATRARGAAFFSDISTMIEEGFASGILRPEARELLSATLDALTGVILEFIGREPAQLEKYRRSGFDTFWGAISAR
jgi:AcrR family transcriptional regulator